MNLEPEIQELLGSVPHDAGSAVPPAPIGHAVGVGGERAIGGAYEGASRHDNAMALWSPPLRSADAEILPAKRLVDARSRDTLRNDAYSAGGANLHRDNIVGAAFTLNAKPSLRALGKGFDETWEEEFQEEVEEKFTLAVESPDCWIDASRRFSLTAMIRLVVGVYVPAGEVLASVEYLRDPDRPFATAIQMIDTDRLSNPPAIPSNVRVRGGVELDSRNAPTAYHVRKAHPTDFGNPDAWQWKRVPIRKPWGRQQMIHIFEPNRIDQSRGISEMVSALKESRMIKSLRNISLQNAVVNATYAASIESDLPTEAVFNSLGGGNMTAESVQEAITNYAEGYLGAIGEYVGNSKAMQIDGVKIPHFFPGTKMKLTPAGSGGPIGSELEESMLRYLAANLGVSYEQLSRDYTKTNYSSARASMAETWKFMQARKKAVADRFASIVYRLWLEEALNKGQISSMPRLRRGWAYEGMNLDALSVCDWIGASRGQIDELKETQAAVLRINNGLSTLEYELARLGQDYRKVMRQLSREKKLKTKYDILQDQTDTTNQMNAASGSKGTKASVEQSQILELEDRVLAIEEKSQ